MRCRARRRWNTGVRCLLAADSVYVQWFYLVSSWALTNILHQASPHSRAISRGEPRTRLPRSCRPAGWFVRQQIFMDMAPYSDLSPGEQDLSVLSVHCCYQVEHNLIPFAPEAACDPADKKKDLKLLMAVVRQYVGTTESFTVDGKMGISVAIWGNPSVKVKVAAGNKPRN